MIVQEVYIGRIPEIEEIFQEFKKMRNEYKTYKTGKNAKNIAKLEGLIEDMWGFKAFSLDIDPSDQPNAYTYPVAMSVDINPGDYIVSTSKGYRYTAQCNAASISYITKGLLTNPNFSDEEVFAVFLHEIGHSFVHRSPMIIAQQEVYKNTLIAQILYKLFLSIFTANVLGVVDSVSTYLMSTNGYKRFVAEYNKIIKKIPLIRELKLSFESMVGLINSTLGNLGYLLITITGIRALSNWLNTKEYESTTKKAI